MQRSQTCSYAYQTHLHNITFIKDLVQIDCGCQSSKVKVRQIKMPLYTVSYKLGIQPVLQT